MDINKIMDNIRDLIQLDIDAVNAYQQADEHIEDDDIRERMEAFKGDHERHVESLSGELFKMGGMPPKRSVDFTGYMIAGFTSLRSVSGTAGALEAMQTNEELTNRRYKDAIEWALDLNVPFEVRRIIQKNYDDERHHLRYISETLRVLSGR